MIAVPVKANSTSVYARAVELAKRMNFYTTLKDEPIAITQNELAEFSGAAVLMHKKPMEPAIMAEAIKQGRFHLGGHLIVVI